MLNKLLYPAEYHDSVKQINYKALYQAGYRGLLFDIDNTLVPYDVHDADEEMAAFFKSLKQMGFKVCLVSNNTKQRVTRFNKGLKIHAIYNTLKPLRRKLRKGIALMGTTTENTVLIGDQIFTDVLGGNRLKLKTILVKPIQEKEQWITKIKRDTEKLIVNSYLKRNKQHGK